MRIVLLYPPPWKIPGPGEPPCTENGPPADFCEGDLDSDFFQTPYGLFTLGAQAIAAGHQVKVFNLSAYPWSHFQQIVKALDADLWGMSCWTANRRGVALAAAEIRATHPDAPIVVGGPHATPLAREMLAHHADIDLACCGESEATFLELISRVEKAPGSSNDSTDLRGIPGTVYRNGTKIEAAPTRSALRDLDALECPHRYFATHIVMTSRGCPWQCTFCGAETSWGRGFRAHSIDYVLSSLEMALARLPVRMIQIKDDTFTTNKKRVIELCRGMRQRKLNFLWSCDTRVDVLSEELLCEMRLAGCERLSLGVESGSQRILDAIDKKITPDEILASTELAKKYGIQVRYYMMLGNRGETLETFRETLDFLHAAKPHEYIFSCLSIYPGTRDFALAEQSGWLNREVYFEGDFQELKVPFDADPACTEAMSEWFANNKGIQRMYSDSVDECRAILSRLGDHHAAHLDLAGALYEAGQLNEAEHHAQRALELGHPTPGLAYNYLAVIAWARGNIPAMQEHFMAAAKTDPQHHVLIQNVQAVRQWFQQSGPERGLPLTLLARHDFQLLERTQQPSLPGPLDDDFADWSKAPRPTPAQAKGIPEPSAVMREGHETVGFQARRLPVVPQGARKLS